MSVFRFVLAHACSQEASLLVPRTLALITERPRINGEWASMDTYMLGAVCMDGHVRHRMGSV